MESPRQLAPERFAEWMRQYQHVDRRYGHVYYYHSRSDAHSIALCTEVLRDLLAICPTLSAQAERDEVVFGIKARDLGSTLGSSE